MKDEASIAISSQSPYAKVLFLPYPFQVVTKVFKVLIAGLNYAPESTGIAPYTTKLAEKLAQRGLRVRVLAGFPHYPQWSVRPGYRGFTMREIVNGVPLTRFRHSVPVAPTLATRTHMEFSFGIRSIFARWHRPDVVLTVSPALFASALAVIRARLSRVPVGIWVQDIYSRGVEELEGSRSRKVRVLKSLEGLILRSASGVSVIHPRFKAYLVNELNVPAERVTVIRNWTHIELAEEHDREATRRRFGWKENETIALHAGNMGQKQNLENVISAAAEAGRRGSPIRFVLLGDGNQRRHLEEYASGVRNITFIDPLPNGEFAAVLQSADVLIVNEMPGVKEMSVPSKLTSYFATGLPIVAATEPDSATSDEISASSAGVRVAPGEPQSLLDAIERLVENSECAATIGASGRPYTEEVLSEDLAIETYSLWLATLAKE